MKKYLKVLILLLILTPTLVFAKDYNVRIEAVDYKLLTAEEQNKIVKQEIKNETI